MTEPTTRPLPEAASRAAWRAVYALREAESVVAGATIVGAADAPPGAGLVDAWASDWASRARDALRRAHEIALDAREGARERARRAARRIAEGARAVREVVRRTRERLSSGAQRAVDAVERGALAMAGINLAAGAGAALVVAWLLFGRKSR